MLTGDDSTAAILLHVHAHIVEETRFIKLFSAAYTLSTKYALRMRLDTCRSIIR